MDQHLGKVQIKTDYYVSIHSKRERRSLHTNIIFPNGLLRRPEVPVFWCECCNKKLVTPLKAREDFSGKSHKHMASSTITKSVKRK